MKFILPLLLLFCLSAPLMAQDPSAAKSNSASTNYTVGDLEKLDKLELTRIYVSKITRLQTLLPYVSFRKLEPKSPNDLKIPANSLNTKAMEKLEAEQKAYNQTLDANLSALAPYSDTRDLISAILFYQGIIAKIELLGVGMNPIGY